MSTAVLNFTGCKKYEDGPRFSLATKKGRITNEWKMTSSLLNGQPDPYIVLNDVWDIKKDGTYTITSTSGYGTTIGSWSFSSDKESITVTENGSSDAYIYKILRLKGNELWLQWQDGSDFFEHHFVAN